MPITLRIRGMDCAEEIAVLEREIGPLVGGKDRLSFDLLRGRMTVDAPGDVSLDRLLAAVARTGMRGEVWTEARDGAAGQGCRSRRNARSVATMASGALTLAAFVLHAVVAGSVAAAIGTEGLAHGHDVPILARVLYALAIAAGGWFVAPKACFAARRLRPDMNLLMTVAVVGAMAIGEWFEAATVAFLFAVAVTLESWSIGRARRAVAALMDLAPHMAHLKMPDGVYRDVAPADVPIGAWVLVRPGERIPLDGVVRQGHSAVDQAPITGESVPVDMDAGSAVFAGTINGGGALEIESTKTAGETTLAHIIHLVGEAHSRRAPAEQWVERFARIYTPAILILAVLVLLVPPLAIGAVWAPWIYRALILLVIGCPCALVISTPVTIIAALTAAAHNGILIKGGIFVEAPARLRAIAFDKTGTLTAGRPAVTEIIALNGHTADEVLQRAASMEAHGEHPIARAIVARSTAAGLTSSPVEDFQILPGRGATARLDGRPHWVASHRYLEERGLVPPALHDRLVRLTQTGHTIVGMGDAIHLCGLIALTDPVRPNAAGALRALRDQGIDHLVMLTGDNQGTAAAIARQTDIDDVQAELLPENKVTTIEALVATYGSVAMVGDGVNDAPALARATVGIAMGAAGSDAAIETADIALMSSDLEKLPWLIRHSRRALGIIRQNIVLALGVKALFVFLTFAGDASLWSAIAADMGVSLLVIANALRLVDVRGGRV